MKNDEMKKEENLLAQKGYKSTKSRKAVLSILQKAETPLSAEDIFLRIKESGQSANLSTVYRTLELLENGGLVEKSVINGGRAMYELVHSGHRHHLICTGCNRIVPIDTCPLVSMMKDIGRKTSFDITGHRLELYGLCPDCREQ